MAEQKMPARKVTESHDISEIKKRRSAKGTVKKKSEITKLRDIFIADDLAKVKYFLFNDVFVPTVKKAISDTVDILLYGAADRGKTNRNPGSNVSYRKYSDSSRDYRRASSSYRENTPRRTYDYDEIIFQTRGEAENILMGLDEIMRKYDIVRVADYYDLAGVTCDYTAMNYGWTNLADACVVRARNGFIISFPKALAID